MPITQDRLITLIEIADKAADRLVVVRGQIEYFEKLSRCTTADEWEERFYNLCDAIKASTWLDRETTDALAEERAHFKFSSKHNIKMREVMHRWRLKKKLELEGQEVNEELGEAVFANKIERSTRAKNSRTQGLDLTNDKVVLYADPFTAPTNGHTEGLDLTTNEPNEHQLPAFEAPTSETGGSLSPTPLRPRFIRKTD